MVGLTNGVPDCLFGWRGCLIAAVRIREVSQRNSTVEEGAAHSHTTKAFVCTALYDLCDGGHTSSSVVSLLSLGGLPGSDAGRRNNHVLVFHDLRPFSC